MASIIKYGPNHDRVVLVRELNDAGHDTGKLTLPSVQFKPGVSPEEKPGRLREKLEKRLGIGLTIASIGRMAVMVAETTDQLPEGTYAIPVAALERLQSEGCLGHTALQMVTEGLAFQSGTATEDATAQSDNVLPMPKVA